MRVCSKQHKRSLFVQEALQIRQNRMCLPIPSVHRLRRLTSVSMCVAALCVFALQLVAAGVMEDVFGLCFGFPSGGTMTLGESPDDNSPLNRPTPTLSSTPPTVSCHLTVP